MKPSIGRIVIVRGVNEDEIPAIVIKVHSTGSINVTAFEHTTEAHLCNLEFSKNGKLANNQWKWPDPV